MARRFGFSPGSAERIGLDHVAEEGAGAVRFQERDLLGLDPGEVKGMAIKATCDRRFGAVTPLLRPLWLVTELP